nr:histone-like nucleoid-structuring protein Lsr2 [Rhodococcus sp. ACS1]
MQLGSMVGNVGRLPRWNPRRGASGRKEIREWATTEGYELSARGRIPAQIEEAYSAAH